MPNPTYINPDGSNGSGTIISPYNSFAEVNALGGDLGGLAIFLKSGTIIRDGFRGLNNGLDEAYNYNVGTYGTGARAKIYNSDIEAGTWIAESSNWYLADSNGHRGVWADDLLLEGVVDKVDLTENQSWYDSGNERIYIILDGTDPNTVVIELQSVHADRQKAFRSFQDTSNTDDSNILVEDLYIARGYDSLWASGLRDNVVYRNLVIRDTVQRTTDAAGAGAGDGAIIYASGSAAAPATVFPTGMVFTNCNVQNSTHNGLEVWGFGDHDINRNILQNNGCGCEYWGYMKDGKFRNNDIRNSISTPTTASLENSLIIIGRALGENQGSNEDIEITNNIMMNSQKPGLDIQAGCHVVAHNYIEGGRSETGNPFPLFYQNSSGSIPGGSPITDIYHHHNVVHWKGSTTLLRMMWAAGLPPTTQTVLLDPDTDFNDYWSDNDSGNWSKVRIQTGTGVAEYTTLALYKAGNAFDQNALNQDPRDWFVDLDGGDFTVAATAPYYVGPTLLNPELTGPLTFDLTSDLTSDLTG